MNGCSASRTIACSPQTLKVHQSRSIPETSEHPPSARRIHKVIFASLEDTVFDGVQIDCADRKVQCCFPILSARAADHMENVTLNGLKSNAWPTGQVPASPLGTNIKTIELEITQDMNEMNIQTGAPRFEGRLRSHQGLQPWYHIGPKRFSWALPGHHA